MEKTQAITSGGFELRYIVEGDGLLTLVIGSAIYYYRTFSKYLRNHLRMAFIDHRGFGKTLLPVENSLFELNLILDDIEVFRKNLGFGRMIIIGHSGHAYMALEYAKMHPQYVSHVVLIAQSPDSSPESFKAADRYLEESVCPERKAYLEKNMKRMASEMESDSHNRFMIYTLRSGPRIWYNYKFDAAPLWKDIGVIPEMFDYVWGVKFRELDIIKGQNDFNIPVFVALGRYDYWNPPHLWDLVRGKFKDLTIRIFEKSGHYPYFEEPRLFDNELLEWVNSHSVPPK